MTTATLEKPKLSDAWRKRNGEANLLAGYLFRHHSVGQTFQSAGAKQECLAHYQKQLILEAAKQMGWTLTSRRELTPEQLGRICTALRGMIEALGLPGPEFERDARAGETQEPTTADWKQFTKVYSDLLAVPRHDDKWFHAWLIKYHRRHTVRGMPREQFRAVIRGLEGVKKHAKAGEAF